jgi:hypothetical protein
MLRSLYAAFRGHLLFFSTLIEPPRLTFLSGPRAGDSLGLDFPVAVILSLSLHLIYVPSSYPLSTINLEHITRTLHRAQLSDADNIRSVRKRSETPVPDLGVSPQHQIAI